MANPNAPISVRPNKKIGTRTGTPTGKRAPTPGASDSQSKAASKNMEPGQVRAAPATGKPRQQTQYDTNAPAPNPKPAPNPYAARARRIKAYAKFLQKAMSPKSKPSAAPKPVAPVAPPKPKNSTTALPPERGDSPAPKQNSPAASKALSPNLPRFAPHSSLGFKPEHVAEINSLNEHFQELGNQSLPDDHPVVKELEKRVKPLVANMTDSQRDALMDHMDAVQDHHAANAAKSASGTTAKPAPANSQQSAAPLDIPVSGNQGKPVARPAKPLDVPAPPPRAKAAPGQPDPGPIKFRSEGEQWKGPSGHWFTQEKGKPKLDPTEAIPVIAPRIVNGKPVAPLPDRIANGEHETLTGDELHAAAKAIIGNNSRVRVTLPTTPAWRSTLSTLAGSGKQTNNGDTFDITDGASLHEFLQRGGKLHEQLDPQQRKQLEALRSSTRKLNGPARPGMDKAKILSPVEKIARKKFDDIDPRDFEDAAKLLYVKQAPGTLKLPDGTRKVINDGRDLEDALRAGAEPRDWQLRRMHPIHKRFHSELAEKNRQTAERRAANDDEHQPAYDRTDFASPTAPFANKVHPVRPNVPGKGLHPDHAEAAARALAGEKGWLSLDDPRGRRHTITDGASLQQYLAAGGTFTDAEHQAQIREAIHAHDLSQAQPVAPKVIAESVKAGQPIPVERFAPAGATLPVTKPDHVELLKSARNWAHAEALKGGRVERLAAHLKIPPKQAHDILTNAMLGVAVHAAKKPIGEPATAGVKITGNGRAARLNLPQSHAAREMVRNLSEHMMAGHELTHSQVADFQQSLKSHLRPDEIQRVANTLNASLTKEQSDNVKQILKYAAQGAAPNAAQGV